MPQEWLKFCDERFGPIQRLVELGREPGSPRVFRYLAQAFNAPKKIASSLTGAGTAFARSRAIMKAIGEAVERTCGVRFDAARHRLASAKELGQPYLRPDELALYTEEQYAASGFPWKPYTESTKIRWFEAHDLHAGTTILVPAAMVFIFYKAEGNTLIAPQISTGMACHSSFEAAVLAGACEVIERDAFSITWQAMLPPPRLRLDTLNSDQRGMVATLEDTGGEVVLFDITTDIEVPTILGSLRGGGKGQAALIFSAAASIHPEVAITKALEELAQGFWRGQRIVATINTIDPGPAFSNVRTLDDHSALYCLKDFSEHAHFLFESTVRKQLSDFSSSPLERDPRSELSVLKERLAQRGYRLIGADITQPEYHQLGLSVVRVIIPGMHPLFFGHRNRVLGGSRLWSVPQLLGYRGIRQGDNPAPHPFA